MNSLTYLKRNAFDFVTASQVLTKKVYLKSPEPVKTSTNLKNQNKSNKSYYDSLSFRTHCHSSFVV